MVIRSHVGVELVLDPLDLLEKLGQLLLRELQQLGGLLRSVGAGDPGLEVGVAGVVAVGQFLGQVLVRAHHSCVRKAVPCTGRKDSATGIFRSSCVSTANRLVPTNYLLINIIPTNENNPT